MLSATALSYHFYADDTQLYISFNSPDSAISLATLSSALDSVHAWLTSDRLSVNPSKTEYLIIGTLQQRSKFTATSLTFQGSLLPCNDKCLVFVVRDLLKVGYLSQVLCEFMQEIFVDVLDLFFSGTHLFPIGWI